MPSAAGPIVTRMSPNPDRPLLHAVGMTCVMPSSSGGTTLFRGLGLDLVAGSIVDLTGPSGSGKSSLLTALALLNPQASGSLSLDGRESSLVTPQEWRAAVMYLPQEPRLLGDTVAGTIRSPWGYAVRRPRGRRDRRTAALLDLLRRPHRRTSERGPSDSDIRGMLDSLGCTDVELDRPPHDLSGGQRARVALCRALLAHPRVLLADEVDAGLDDDSAELVGHSMTEAAALGMAVLRVRHRASDGLADRTLELRDGVLR